MNPTKDEDNTVAPPPSATNNKNIATEQTTQSFIEVIPYETFDEKECQQLTKALNDEILGERTYTSRLIGKQPSLVLHGGGNTSMKDCVMDVFNNPIEVLFVKGSGFDLKSIVPKGFSCCKMDHLKKLLRLDALSDVNMVNELRSCMLDASSPTPSVEALLHALIPHKFVDHSHADAILVLANQPEAQAREYFLRAFESNPKAKEMLLPTLIVPYVMPGFDLAKVVNKMFEPHYYKSIILLKHGLFTFGGSAKESYENHILAVSTVENFLREFPPHHQQQRLPLLQSNNDNEIISVDDEFYVKVLCCLRGCLKRLDPENSFWIVHHRIPPTTKEQDLILNFIHNERLCDHLSQLGTATPDHVIRTKRNPLIIRNVHRALFYDNANQPPILEEDEPINALVDLKIRQFLETKLKQYMQDYLEYFNKHKNDSHVMLDPLPRVILMENFGLITLGRTFQEASIAADIYERTIRIAKTAHAAFACYDPCCAKDLFDCEYWSLEQAKLKTTAAAKQKKDSALCMGKIVLVTGGASGIGLACAKLFSAEGGCSVVVLDVSRDRVEEMRKKFPHFLSLQCDVTSPLDLRACVKKTVAQYGGVDILISNAGVIYQSNGGMANVPRNLFAKSLGVNFFSHQWISSIVTKIFITQHTGGRLLFNVSKAALNPGNEMGPYAVAKAALGALMRQYSVDYAPFQITSNAVNADRVNTNIFDEKTVEERAKARGLSKEDYFKANALQLEVQAEDVAKAFFSLANSEKTTGMYFTVDGGNIAAAPR